MSDYPCKPAPFETAMGTVQICALCGHYQDEEKCKTLATRPAANVEAEPVAIKAAKVWQDARNAYHANTKPDPDNPRFSIPGTTEAAAVIASALEQVRKDADARIEALEAKVKEAVEALAEIAQAIKANGPIVVDAMGEGLGWRPLDYGTWTPLAKLQEPSHD